MRQSAKNNTAWTVRISKIPIRGVTSFSSWNQDLRAALQHMVYGEGLIQTLSLTALGCSLPVCTLLQPCSTEANCFPAFSRLSYVDLQIPLAILITLTAFLSVFQRFAFTNWSKITLPLTKTRENTEIMLIIKSHTILLIWKKGLASSLEQFCTYPYKSIKLAIYKIMV